MQKFKPAKILCYTACNLSFKGILLKLTHTVKFLACSRLSDNGGERKIGASDEKKRVGIGDGGAGAGEKEDEGEPVRLSLLILFRPLLSPTWIIGFLLSRCPSVNLLKSFSVFFRSFPRPPRPRFFSSLARIFHSPPLSESLEQAIKFQ